MHSHMYDCLRVERKGVSMGKLQPHITTIREKEEGTGNSSLFISALLISPLHEKAGLQQSIQKLPCQRTIIFLCRESVISIYFREINFL